MQATEPFKRVRILNQSDAISAVMSFLSAHCVFSLTCNRVIEKPLTQECDVGRAVADELEKRSSDEQSKSTFRRDDVDDGEDGRHEADSGRQQYFEDYVTSTETEKTFVPE